MSEPSPQWRNAFESFLPTRRAWLLIGGACVVGMLLFAVLWLGNRDDATADADALPDSAATGRRFEPLPAPLPAAADGASGMDTSASQGAPVRIDEHVAPVAAPATALPDGVTMPASADDPASQQGGIALSGTRVPRPVSSPPPNYPRAAMRRGETGDVLLRVHVDAEGRTSSVDIVSSSQSRRLDRAATSAVQRWRFEPALRDGQPVPGELLIPFEFAPTP